MSEPPRLAVSIVTFHSDLGRIRRTAEGLADQQPPVWRTLVRVNESSDAELAAVTSACSVAPGLTVVPSTHNSGFSGGHNDSLAALFDAGADGVLVLNPDLRLAPTALESLWAGTVQYAGRCLVGPLLEQGSVDLVPTGRIDSAGIRWTLSARHLDARQGEPLSAAPREDREVPGLTGACLLVPRAAYNEVIAASGEFFDEDFVAYREDAELGLRVTALGIPCLLRIQARGIHARGLYGTSRAASPFINRLSVQNRFLIRFKHGRARPGNVVLATARDVVVLLGAALIERSSWPGVTSAWRLRGRMRDKRKRLLATRS